ncbi:MAG: hypothetical protein FJ206_03910 [Gemmatimonadetes bacterium]|nr:hypothetical protein [Gemmatimonadota bacterium]
MIAVALCLVAALTPSDLASIGERARIALAEHRFIELLPPRQAVRLELPSGAVGALTRGSLAARILTRRTLRHRTLSVELRRTELLDDRHGFLELVRRFEVRGSREVQQETVLIGAALAGSEWEVVEILVLEAGPGS